MYGKHFESMYTGSMYGAGCHVFVLWGYVIAHAIKGEVELNPKMIASTIGDMTPQEVEQAIAFLCSPDEESRSEACDGRRLIQLSKYSYRVVNHHVYNKIRNQDERREYNREAKRRERERKQSESMSNRMSMTVNDCQAMSAHTEAYTDTDTNIPNPNGLGAGSKLPSCPHQQIIDIYHEVLPMLPRVKIWNASRQAHLRARWRNNPDLEGWRDFFQYVGESKFLTGQSSTNGDRKPFVADLEWIVKQSNFTKIIEGKYHD